MDNINFSQKTFYPLNYFKDGKNIITHLNPNPPQSNITLQGAMLSGKYQSGKYRGQEIPGKTVQEIRDGLVNTRKYGKKCLKVVLFL